MIDLKRTKEEKKKSKTEPAPSMEATEAYPYGSRISFGEEEISKIDSLQNLQIGQKVTIAAEGKVVEVRASEQEGGKPRANVEIQIQKIDITAGKKEEETTTKKGSEQIKEKINKQFGVKG